MSNRIILIHVYMCLTYNIAYMLLQRKLIRHDLLFQVLKIHLLLQCTHYIVQLLLNNMQLELLIDYYHLLLLLDKRFAQLHCINV